MVQVAESRGSGDGTSVFLEAWSAGGSAHSWTQPTPPGSQVSAFPSHHLGGGWRSSSAIMSHGPATELTVDPSRLRNGSKSSPGISEDEGVYTYEVGVPMWLSR